MNPLITVADLALVLVSATPPTLFDVRWSLQGGGPSQYAEGHIPGAAFLDLDSHLAGPAGVGGRHPLPDPEILQRALRDLGVRADCPIVVYDGGGPVPIGAAARAWWILRWAGHRDVRVLDGGFAAWIAEDRPVSTESVERPTGDFVVVPDQMPVLDAGGAAERGAAGALIDARAAQRYRGEVEPVDRVAGHIPGAVNQPLADTVTEDGRLLDPQTLRERFVALGVPEGGPVGAYCGSGVTAAHTVLALAIAGFVPALYVGSWSEWIIDPHRAVAVGDAP